MVSSKKKYIQHEFFQKDVVKTEQGDNGPRVIFQLVISCTNLTDEEDAKLKDILREAAEKADTFLGW